MMRSDELYACIYVSEFPAQASLRLRPQLRQSPCVVLEGNPPLQRVCSMNRKARAEGVVSGMTRSEVETFSSMNVLLRSHREESSAASALMQCAGTFSPRMENRSRDHAFTCVLDISGTERLFGSAGKLAQTIHSHIRSLGFSSCIATSSNAHASVLLARSLSLRSPVLHVVRGQQREALSQLPISVLDLTEEQAGTLSLWGIHTLAMLAALPEDGLIARMGQTGRRLRQLARGELPHHFQPIDPPFTLEEHIDLDTPIELLDSLLFVIGSMLEELIRRAASRYLALTSVTLELQLEGSTSHKRSVRPALPSNNKTLWLKLLHLDLEAHPPNASILSVTLTAEHGNTTKVQLGLFSPQLPEPSNLDVTLARIARLVGEANVGNPVLKDSNRPDDFLVERFRISETSNVLPERSSNSSVMRQLRLQEEIAVTFDRQPKKMLFREQCYSVERAYGPWLSGGEWWNAHSWNIEQWDIVARTDTGELLCGCLVRDMRDNRWKMVSLYD